MQEYLNLTVQYDSDDSNDDSDNDTDFETGIFVNTSIPVFLVGFNFGSREAAQLAALDTGCNLLWVQCKLDRGGNRTFYRNYWPAESSTYSVNVRCVDFYSSTPLTCIPTPTLCWYLLKYLGEVIVRGNPAFERFIFGSSFDNQPAHELNPLFGWIKSGGVEFSTLLIIREFDYYVNLEGISFGGRMLGIDKKDLRMDNFKSGGGATIDSGSGLSFL
ncbi:uncharacterized protein [Coffea arabica]|uniref:Uncharacterized protein n=1 Tax=Coffea arabica TaxID=13443 RepID=A0ABM4UYM1_COFAR